MHSFKARFRVKCKASLLKSAWDPLKEYAGPPELPDRRRDDDLGCRHGYDRSIHLHGSCARHRASAPPSTTIITHSRANKPNDRQDKTESCSLASLVFCDWRRRTAPRSRLRKGMCVGTWINGFMVAAGVIGENRPASTGGIPAWFYIQSRCAAQISGLSKEEQKGSWRGPFVVLLYRISHTIMSWGHVVNV